MLHLGYTLGCRKVLHLGYTLGEESPSAQRGVPSCWLFPFHCWWIIMPPCATLLSVPGFLLFPQPFPFTVGLESVPLSPSRFTVGLETAVKRQETRYREEVCTTTRTIPFHCWAVLAVLVQMCSVAGFPAVLWPFLHPFHCWASSFHPFHCWTSSLHPFHCWPYTLGNSPCLPHIPHFPDILVRTNDARINIPRLLKPWGGRQAEHTQNKPGSTAEPG